MDGAAGQSSPKSLMAIHRVYKSLPEKKRLIADHILKNPAKVIRDSITALARDCGCNQTTIVRFCREIGYGGFPEFKISLASDMSGPLGQFGGRIEAKDGFSKVKEELLATYSRALNDTFAMLSEQDVKRAVGFILKAERILFAGVGASGLVAADAQVKLMRLGFDAAYHADCHLQRMNAALLGAHGLLIAVSFSGETREVVESAAIAKRAGAKIISITNFSKSSLSGVSDVSLFSVSVEGKDRLAAMSSRIVQSAVIDFLALQITLKDLDKVNKSFAKSQEVALNENY